MSILFSFAKRLRNLLLIFVFINSAKANFLNYSESGGGISGTLNGVSFSNATFLITATADTSTITYTNSNFPLYSAFVTPALSIFSGGNTSTVALLDSGSNKWQVLSGDLSAYSPNTTEIGFGIPSGANTLGAALNGPGYFNNLNTPQSFSGNPLWNTNFPFLTSVGNLFITSSTAPSGTFIISSVPEPNTFALLGLSALFALISCRQKRGPVISID